MKASYWPNFCAFPALVWLLKYISHVDSNISIFVIQYFVLTIILLLLSSKVMLVHMLEYACVVEVQFGSNHVQTFLWTNQMPNLFDCSPLLNSFQQFISFVICFLVLGIVMEFKEWNLNMALYYGGFNFITPFHFQYSTSDPISLATIIFHWFLKFVSNRCCIPSNSIFIPFIFWHVIESILICIPFPHFSPSSCNICFPNYRLNFQLLEEKSSSHFHYSTW